MKVRETHALLRPQIDDAQLLLREVFLSEPAP